MPDWSYRTVFRPLLFRLPPAAARDLCLGVMGMLARVPLGPAIIDFLGHMRPAARLRRSFLGVTFPAAVGLAPGLDAQAIALPALARFGFGFLEVGPVTLEPLATPRAIQRRPGQQAIWYPDPPVNPGLAALARRLSRAAPLPVPLIVRLGSVPGMTANQVTDECRRIVEHLAPHADLFSLAPARPFVEGTWSDDPWRKHLRAVLGACRHASSPRGLVLCVPADLDPARADLLLGPAVELGIEGVIVDGSIGAAPAGRLIGLPAREPALERVGHLRRCWPDLVIIGSGGVHEPDHALQLREAGADLVEVDSGLVYAGPGLPKRINDALLFVEGNAAKPEPEPASAVPSAEMAWFWTLTLGVSMLLGGVLALLIASTRVVLPYDESFVGMTRRQLAAVNGRLLAFMTHDRVTLAGTMIAVGVLYVQLSRFGIRRGLHWARVAVLGSAFSGFASFFLFLGFGYFDPFHAFVTAILFQFLLLGVHGRQAAAVDRVAPNLHDDWRWRWSQWGQLLFVVQGCVYLVAGLVIAAVGITRVFVPEDLEFMGTTPAAIAAANPRLLPLIAHDRASFGGMLIACGLVVLLAALWGYRRGYRWLWWTLLAAGTPAYAAAIGVHLAVGYTNWRHLAPAVGGCGVFLVGLGLSYPYLCQTDPRHGASWQRHLGRVDGAGRFGEEAAVHAGSA